MKYRILCGIVMSVSALSLAVAGCGVKKEEAVSRKTEPAATQAAAPKAAEEQRPEAQLAPLKITEEKVLFDFERGEEGWEIPMWAEEQDDYVAASCGVSQDVAGSGSSSLKVDADFKGDAWRAGLVEIEQYFDWGPYDAILVDVYVPKDAPEGLRGKLILTVGDKWKWAEMSTSTQLVPGEWTTIQGDLRPGSYDWKRTVPDEQFRRDVRKLAVRVESNKRPVYNGPFYVDNVRLGK